MADQQQDSIYVPLTVRTSAAKAFEAFTHGFGSWYPSEYTWSGAVLERIGMEPGEGGHCYEEGPHGFRLDWGRVITWQPGERLALTWQIAFDRVPTPDPARASEIEVTWRPEGEELTRVDFNHRHFQRHGGEWRAYRDALASPGGWPYILDRYVAALAGHHG